MPILRRVLFDLLNLIRNGVEDPANRVSYTTDSFVGDGSTENFKFTEDKVKNVKSVKLNGNEAVIRDDYFFDGDYLKFSDAPEDGSTIVVEYGYGYSFIYPGYRLSDNTKAPQITIQLIGPTQRDKTIGASRVNYNINPQVDVWCDISDSYSVDDGQNLRGSSLRDYMTDQLINAIRERRVRYPDIIKLRIADMRNVEENVEDLNLTRKTIDLDLKFEYKKKQEV